MVPMHFNIEMVAFHEPERRPQAGTCDPIWFASAPGRRPALQLLEDPYAAGRYLAGRSLKRCPGSRAANNRMNIRGL